MQTKGNRKTGIADLPTIVTARRALGITKTYIAIAVFFSLLAITVWGNVMYVGTGTNSTSNSTVSNVLAGNAVTNTIALAGNGLNAGSGTPLLAVPLDMVPLLMIATPVVLLFVYDKNNGVLEYLLSLGMTQRDIYMRYLKASLLLVVIFFVLFVPAVLAYGYLVYGAAAVATILPIPLLAIPFALALTGFMIMAMMSFSALQKARIGSNQPLGMLVGLLGTAPAYLVPFLFTFGIGIYVDLGIAVVIAVIALVFLRLSGKLIRRENFLP